MKNVYYISGLGADERVFNYLKLTDVREKYIKWVVPEKHESLHSYCKRLTTQIDLTNDIILIGVSFGGIVAQEISKIIRVNKVIIISSVKSPKEFDWKLRCVRFLKLHRLAPSRFLKWSNSLTGDYYFGTETKAESDLLKLIIKDTDRFFMKWAIEEIMGWNNNQLNSGLIHIHGDKDRIFPTGRIKNAINISNGGHFMIVNRAKEISELIEKEISLKQPG
jgi:pimeloyl-ACP methyl ester carboxylesterase